MSIDELWRYDGKRAVVTGCASGIGAHVARQLTELGAEVVGLDVKRPALQLKEFHEVDLGDAAAIDRAAEAIDGPVNALFNIAGVSSGIKDPLRVVTINFLGTRHFIEAMVPRMPPGSAIANVSSLAASTFRENAVDTVGLLDTASMADGIEWCRCNPGPVAYGGGYRLSKEALILYGMANVAALGAKGIRINCTGPGVTDTPILDQLRSAYGQEFLDSFQTPLGRVAGPDEQASVLVFLNSDAARYISGQVIWVDGGSVAERVFGDVTDERRAEHGQPE